MARDSLRGTIALRNVRLIRHDTGTLHRAMGRVLEEGMADRARTASNTTEGLAICDGVVQWL